MVAHLVLFKPKPTLTGEEREAFMTALEHALTNIPLIKSARVGRRVQMDRPYDRLNAMEFPYAAVLEFENEADLRAYLEHPAHAMLGAQFYRAAEAAMAFDYEWVSVGELR
jgi:hypothetical protein